VVEVRGVPFCEGCVREQEAYFAVGELVQEVQGLRNEPLVEVLDRIRWERTGYTTVAEMEKVKVMLGTPE
jgi:hypothetical protein